MQSYIKYTPICSESFPNSSWSFVSDIFLDSSYVIEMEIKEQKSILLKIFLIGYMPSGND